MQLKRSQIAYRLSQIAYRLSLIAYSLSLIAFCALPARAQVTADYAYRMVPVRALPASCNPANGEMRYLTTGATGAYVCTASNTWTRVDGSGLINVKAYGAVGNGTANDAAAVQAAVTAGGTVVFPPGTYLLGSTVHLTSNLRLMGVGNATVTTSGNFPMFDAPVAGVTNVGAVDLSFLGRSQDYAVGLNGSAFYLAANRATLFTVDRCIFDRLTYGVYAETGNSRIYLRNSQFTRMSASSIRAEAVNDGEVKGNYVNGDRTGVGDGLRQRVGVWILGNAGGATLGGQNWIVSNNDLANFYNEGIIVQAAYSKITNNIIRHCASGLGGTYCVTVEGTLNNYTPGTPPDGWYSMINDNLIEDGEGGLRVSLDGANPGDSPQDVDIRNNTIRNITASAQSGIFINSGAAGHATTIFRFHVVGNKIYDVHGAGNSYGIVCYSCNNSSIESNFIDTITKNGIVIDSGLVATQTSSNILVSNNFILNTGVLGNGRAIYLNGRGANGLTNISVIGNFMNVAGHTGNGIFVDDNVATSSVDCAFLNNVVYGDTVNNFQAYRWAGQNLTAINNVGYNINGDNVNTFTGTGANISYRTFQSPNKALNTLLYGNFQLLGTTQATLGAPPNGTVIYCSDCTIASPCAGGGTGALAKRLNGAWVCN